MHIDHLLHSVASQELGDVIQPDFGYENLPIPLDENLTSDIIPGDEVVSNSEQIETEQLSRDTSAICARRYPGRTHNAPRRLLEEM